MKNNLHIDFKFDEDKFLEDLYEEMKHCMEDFIHNKIGCYVEFLPDNGITTETTIDTSGLEKELAKFKITNYGCEYCTLDNGAGKNKEDPDGGISFIFHDKDDYWLISFLSDDTKVESANITHCPWCGRDLMKGTN